MSILDDIHKQAKNSKESNENEDDKILEFTNSYTVEYRAFSAPTSDPQLRLRIYSKKTALMPRYDLLYDVVHSGIADFVGLIYPHMQVKMFGRNLNPLIDAFVNNSVEWVLEYHPPFFEFAKGDDIATLPCIDEIIIEHAKIDPEAEIKNRADINS